MGTRAIEPARLAFVAWFSCGRPATPTATSTPSRRGSPPTTRPGRRRDLGLVGCARSRSCSRRDAVLASARRVGRPARRVRAVGARAPVVVRRGAASRGPARWSRATGRCCSATAHPGDGRRSRGGFVSLVPTQLHRLLDVARRRAPRSRASPRSSSAAARSTRRCGRARAEAGVRLVATYGSAETCGGCVYDGLPLDGVGARARRPTGGSGSAGPTLFDGYLDDDRRDRARSLVDGWFLTSDAGPARRGRPAAACSAGSTTWWSAAGSTCRRPPSPRGCASTRRSRPPRCVGVADHEWGNRVSRAPAGRSAGPRLSTTPATGWRERTRGPGRRASVVVVPTLPMLPTARSTGSRCVSWRETRR